MVFKYTTSYLVMICYFNYAWLLVLGVGCWVLGVGCRQATISMCDAWVRVRVRVRVRVSRYGLPRAIIRQAFGHSARLPLITQDYLTNQRLKDFFTLSLDKLSQ